MSNRPNDAHIAEELDLAEQDLMRSARRLRSLLHTLGSGEFRKAVAAIVEQITKLGGEVQGLGKKLETDEQKKPTHCPYCGGTSIMDIGSWSAQSLEPHDGKATLEEYQCRSCDYRSFWC
jgi:DNA-directed RNA polymerase subunit RPC12/RpoP